MGIAELGLQELEPDVTKGIELNLLASLDTLKVKDKDRGSLTIKTAWIKEIIGKETSGTVSSIHKGEAALGAGRRERILEERKKMKEAGLIENTMDILGGTASLVGSRVGLVGTGIEAGIDLVGSCIGAGAGPVGSGLNAGVRLVGSGLSAVGRAGKFMGKNVTSPFNSSKKNGDSDASLTDGRRCLYVLSQNHAINSVICANVQFGFFSVRMINT